MATLALTIGLNIAIGLAINEFFGPDDIESEGPRLSDRGLSPSTYSRFIDIGWGTDRHECNLVDSTDPPIEEVASSDSSRVGKGLGGQKVDSTQYQYFHTGRWSLGISGATAILQMYVNEKLVYDATSTGNLARAGVDFTFYPGGEDQEQDPGEVSQYGSDEAQGYRHLSTVVLNRLPLSDLGNTVRNVSIVAAYGHTNLAPFEFMNESDTQGVPGGGGPDYMQIDAANDLFYAHGRSNRFWSATLSSFTILNDTAVGDGFADRVADHSRHHYTQTGSNNAGPLDQIDADTGEVLATFGVDGIDLTDDSNSIGNGGDWGHLRATFAGFGIFEYIVHMNQFGEPNGSIYQVEDSGTITQVEILSTAQGFEQTFPANFIGDHDRNRGFFLTPLNAGGFRLIQMDVELTIGILGAQLGRRFTTLRDFTEGSPGDDFPGGKDPAGWAVDRSTGHLLLSNDNDLVLYDPDTDTIIASRSDIGIKSRFNYYSGTVFAFLNGANTNSTEFMRVIDTRTLELLQTIDLDTLSWPSGNGTSHNFSSVWDDDRNAVIFSRTSGARDERITRLFINRLQGNNVVIDTLMSDLMTTYQDMELGGLSTDDFDVTPLSVFSLPGLTINRVSTLRDVANILRRRFFFDVIVSDWIIKFIVRGAASSLTIPAELIGQATDDTVRNPPVERMAIDESDLPMRLNMRYRNSLSGYAPDVEHDKRMRKPDPLVNTKEEETITLSIADIPTDIKQTVQKWLWTTWNEEGRNATKLPWHYIALDPADVVTLTVFNELITTRLSDVKNALGWFLEINGIEEDARSYLSTVVGQNSAGFIAPIIPGGKDTKLLFLDAPLLDLSDLVLDTHSNAYIAFRAFVDDWPGGTAFKSSNDINFDPAATSAAEAAVGKITVPPGTLSRGGKAFRNSWQEVADGGTMTIVPFRRSDAWQSKTDLEVYNGANGFAIITSSGVEIIQYADVTVNDDGTLTLERLLRGRLGTEDIVDDDNHAVGNFVCFLEIGPVTKQRVTVNELNVSFVYRGVTVGTFIEDAFSDAFTYTGRDLKPYSLIDIDLVDAGGGDKDITFVRRCRGPGIGTLSKEPPLNETVETYRGRLKDSGGTAIVTKDVSTELISYTAAEIASAGDGSTIEVTQVSGSGLESPVTPDCTVDVIELGDQFVFDSANVIEGSGSKVTTFGISSSAFTAAVGDTIIAAVCLSNDINSGPGALTSDGGDFNAINKSEVSAGAIPSYSYVDLWEREVTSSEPSTYDWSWATGMFASIAIMVIRNNDLADVVDDEATFLDNNGSTIILPSITPTGNPHFAVTSWNVTAKNLNPGNPTSQPANFILVESARDASPADQDARYRFGLGFEEIPDGGATGTRTFTFQATASNNPVVGCWALLNKA